MLLAPPIIVDEKRSVYVYWYAESNVLKLDLGLTVEPGGKYDPTDFEKIKVRKTPMKNLPGQLEGFIVRNKLQGRVASEIASRIKGLKTT